MGQLLHQKNRHAPGIGGKGFFGALPIPPLIEIFDVPGAAIWTPHPNAFIVRAVAVSGGMGGGGANNTAITPGQFLEGLGGAGGGWASASYAATALPASVNIMVGAGGAGMPADTNQFNPANFGDVSWFGGTPGSNPGFYVFGGAPTLSAGNPVGGIGQALGGALQILGVGGTPGRGGQGITVLPPNPQFPGNLGTNGAPGGAGSGGHVGLPNGGRPAIAAPLTFNPGALASALYAGAGGNGGTSSTVPGGTGQVGAKYGGGGGGGGLGFDPAGGNPIPSGPGGAGGGGAVIVITTFR